MNILVVDDEPEIIKCLSAILEDEGYRTFCALNGSSALKIINEESIDLVLLDLKLPDIDGIEVLRRIKDIDPNTCVVMISGNATIAKAVESTKLGAYDFIEKPFSPPEKVEAMLLTIKQALERRALEQENRFLKSREADKYELIGQSPVMLKLHEAINMAASTKARVLITGENGSGKELVARAIHRRSGRASGRFVVVNCAAIPQELVESELFGHEKGAFTNAHSRQIGKFEQANGGTLFLDEIGDMSLSTQSKVLRAIEDETIQRIGGTKPIKLDVRIISATNKALEEEIERGKFRQDLFYRLNVFPIAVPPLRERKDDIPLLANHFIKQFCRENGKPIKALSNRAIDVLKSYDWPGNVRELRNIIERLIIMVDSNVIEAHHVSETIDLAKPAMAGTSMSLRRMLEEYEKKVILGELERNHGNISLTARNLHVDRANLYRKLRSYGVIKTHIEDGGL